MKIVDTMKYFKHCQKKKNFPEIWSQAQAPNYPKNGPHSQENQSFIGKLSALSAEFGKSWRRVKEERGLERNGQEPRVRLGERTRKSW